MAEATKADFKIAIVGAGPGGLSAAAQAAAAGVSHVLLESAPHLANTIQRYQKGKHVMAEPARLPLRSPLPFEVGTRERVLERWVEGAKATKLNVRHRAEVTAISGSIGAFRLELKGQAPVTAERVVLSIGLQGNPRKLGVPGEDPRVVHYSLDDPGAHNGDTIVVVGAGDAAIENALALAEANTVVLVNRKDEFARAKEGNLTAILAAIDKQRIQCFYNASVAKIIIGRAGGKPCTVTLNTARGAADLPADLVIARLGAVPPRAFVEACGIRFPNDEPDAIPLLKYNYESNVPGIYVIGALGGYPLIKQSMNQGYEVVEHIRGNRVKPADHDLLAEKFAVLGAGTEVNITLANMQRAIPLFSHVNPLQFRELMLESTVHRPAAGSVVFEHNDYTNTLYAIFNGTVEVSAGSKRIGIKRGSFFGEMGLLSGRRRTATVHAGDDCVLIEVPRRTMNKLIASNAAVKRLIDEAFIARAVQSRFAPNTPDAVLKQVVAGAKLHTFPASAIVFREGEDGDRLHLVRSGSLTVARQSRNREVVVSYVPAGKYVGEMGLLGGTKRSATVRAAVATETVSIDAAGFALLMQHEPGLREEMQAEMRQRLAANARMEAQPDTGDVLSFLMAQGLGEATDVLLIDESLCIRCNNCETACAETHDGTSRLDREAGPTFANVHVPTSCRHCEHPHCMKDCPPDAIHRSPNGEIFIADNCIGCGNCERNCPYGVIQMASAPAPQPPIWQWLLFGRGEGPGEHPNRKPDPLAAKKAVKCDMCSGLKGGPACVRACPTGAAVRIRPESFQKFGEQD
jgi:CRP-like cAMP-binding protein/thioredoxin reductase/Pyruvate/2-oxoacid:ferredoxin oxidoreductase delta subunit